MYSFGIDRFADNKFPAVEALSCSTNPNLWVPTKNTDAIITSKSMGTVIMLFLFLEFEFGIIE
jgi:hypothetical protein